MSTPNEYTPQVAEMLRRLATDLESGNAVLVACDSEAESVNLAPLSDEEWEMQASTGRMTLSITYVWPETEAKYARTILERMERRP